MDDDPSFGRWLQRRRRALDLTQTVLAQQVGCTPDHLRNIEADRRRPSREVAERLAAFLIIEVADRPAFVRFARGERSGFSGTDTPAAAPLSYSRHHNLPVQRQPLFVRERELGQVTTLLRRPDVGLVTLTGPGGVGKTRLALQSAADLAWAFADGVVFVALEAIADPALVLPAVAHALNILERREQPILDRLSAVLRDREMLLVLDNFEQVLAAAPAVATLLRTASRLTVLVTSRAPLHVHAEQVVPVPPLATPDPHHLPDPAALAQVAAVALFVRRA